MPKRILQGIVTSNTNQKDHNGVSGEEVYASYFEKDDTEVKKYTAHDDENKCGIGDIVRIQEVRQNQKTKGGKY